MQGHLREISLETIHVNIQGVGYPHTQGQERVRRIQGTEHRHTQELVILRILEVGYLIIRETERQCMRGLECLRILEHQLELQQEHLRGTTLVLS